jgi:hypothetical protein
MPLTKSAAHLPRTLALVVFALLCLAAGARAQNSPAPVVSKVEPPSWWAAHTINPVRLLVRGANLHGARVTPQRAGTEASAVVVNPAGTYVFVSVHISVTAAPGDYPLTLETRSGKTSIPFRLNAPLSPATHFQGITTDDVIYLIMPDRFANGDPSNDIPPGAPPAATDRRNPRAFHGGDLRGIINRLPYLKELGVTALWLNPWYDNWNGINACDKPWCPNTYYHGYHAIDYYAVEDRFGNMETLRELVEKAHASGIKLIQDQVANHIGSQHPWVADPPLDNWFHGTLARHVQNPFRAEDAYAFARQTADETIILAFNRAAAPKKINAPAAFAAIADGAELVPLIVATERARVAGGDINFEVPARTAVAYRGGARRCSLKIVRGDAPRIARGVAPRSVRSERLDDTWSLL